MAILNETISILEELKIDFWLDGGTLLGNLWRHYLKNIVQDERIIQCNTACCLFVGLLIFIVWFSNKQCTVYTC